MLPQQGHHRPGYVFWISVLLLIQGGFAPPASHAEMILTPDGVAAGFQLSTFADSFPYWDTSLGGFGPIGIAFPASGGVLVSDYPGHVRLFPTDTDGQHASLVPPALSIINHNTDSLARVGSTVYMTQMDANTVVQLNDDGTINQTIVSGLHAGGMVANPANGHLLVSSNGYNQIYDVDPVAKTFTVLMNVGLAGLTISPDGRVLYGGSSCCGASSNGHLLGLDTTTGLQVFDAGVIAGGIMGSALGIGPLADDIFVNTLDGMLVEVNLDTLTQTIIATGGSLGEGITIDPNNGSFLLTQSDEVLRLSPPTSPVPEPSTLLLLGSGLAGLGGVIWRRHRRG